MAANRRFLGQTKTFFGRFKDRVKESGEQDPGGRYMSTLLEQLLLEHPSLAKAIFPGLTMAQAKRGQPRIEWPFKIDGRERYADLALVDTDGTLLGIAEVKEEDQLSPHVPEQTKDYLTLVKRRRHQGQPAHLSYITKHMPERSTLECLKARGVEPTYYRDLFTRVSPLLTKSSAPLPVAKLFCDYLREEGVVYQTPADEDGLKLLLIQSMARSRTGFGRVISADRIEAVPEQLEMMLSNVEALGRAFYTAYRKHFGNKFTTSFSFEPYYNARSALGELKDSERDNYLDVPVSLTDHLTGGCLYFNSYGRIKVGGSQLYLTIGFSYDLTAFKASNSVERSLFVQIEGPKKLDHWKPSKVFKKFPSEKAALRSLEGLARKVIKTTLADNKAKKFKGPLNSLLKALGS